MHLRICGCQQREDSLSTSKPLLKTRTSLPRDQGYMIGRTTHLILGRIWGENLRLKRIRSFHPGSILMNRFRPSVFRDTIGVFWYQVIHQDIPKCCARSNIVTDVTFSINSHHHMYRGSWSIWYCAAHVRWHYNGKYINALFWQMLHSKTLFTSLNVTRS